MSIWVVCMSGNVLSDWYFRVPAAHPLWTAETPMVILGPLSSGYFHTHHSLLSFPIPGGAFCDFPDPTYLLQLISKFHELYVRVQPHIAYSPNVPPSSSPSPDTRFHLLSRAATAVACAILYLPDFPFYSHAQSRLRIPSSVNIYTHTPMCFNCRNIYTYLHFWCNILAYIFM